MNDKITPPEGLEDALAAALTDENVTPARASTLTAERLLYSPEMQEWLATQRLTPTEKGETAAEPRDPLQVVCTVRVDLSSPHAVADALSRVPINATVTYEPGQGILSGLLGVGTFLATWTEER